MLKLLTLVCFTLMMASCISNNEDVSKNNQSSNYFDYKNAVNNYGYEEETMLDPYKVRGFSLEPNNDEEVKYIKGTISSDDDEDVILILE